MSKLSISGILIVLTVTAFGFWRPASLITGSAITTGDAGNISTLYALDPLLQSLCFAGGKPGHVVQDYEVRNSCSDLDFGNYHANSFSTGIEGGRLGVIVDLGDSVTLAREYHYQETVGGGQDFASLRLQSGKIVVLKDFKNHEVQELAETNVLFGKGGSNASAAVKLGHLYLLRITDRFDAKFERLVKFMVVTFTPEQAVTIRWQLL